MENIWVKKMVIELILSFLVLLDLGRMEMEVKEIVKKYIVNLF